MNAVRTRLTGAEDLREMRTRAVAEQQRRGAASAYVWAPAAWQKGRRRSFRNSTGRPSETGQGSLVVGVKCTGCHGFCERGPLVVVDPGNLFYQEVKAEDVPEIWRESVMAGRVVERLLYSDEQTGRLCTTPEEIPFYREQTRIVLAHNGVIDPTRIEEYLAVGRIRRPGQGAGHDEAG